MAVRQASLSPTLALAIIAAVWIGLVIGVSFVATPVKFLAPSLTLPVALDVGRHTFMVLSRIEWGLSALLLLLALSTRDLVRGGVALAVVAIVALEAIWLLPVLDARVELIFAGEHPEPTFHHVMFIGLEVAKIASLAALVAAGWLAACRQIRRAPPEPFS